MTRTIQLPHSCTTSASLGHVYASRHACTYVRVDHGRSVAYIRYIYGCDLWDHAWLLQHVCPVLQLIRLASSRPLFLRETVEPFPAIRDANISPGASLLRDSSTFPFSRVLIALPVSPSFFARLLIKAHRASDDKSLGQRCNLTLL